MHLQELAQGAGGLSPQQLAALQQLAGSLTPAQLAWVSGYLAATANLATAAPQAVTAAPASSSAEVTVLYGSQTGNSRGVAKGVAAKLEAQGNGVTLVSMADFKPKKLKDLQRLVVVVSTHGEGEPPDDAIGFHKFLFSSRAPKLNQLEYSVLALGDSSYDQFCQTGKEIDDRLAELGASALVARVDCDVDFEDAAEQWTEALLPTLKAEVAALAPLTATASAVMAESQYTRANPFEAPLLLSQKITGRDSIKDIRHIELGLDDSGIQYQPGDALGVWVHNDAELVSTLLAALDLNPADEVTIKQQSLPLSQALTQQLELTLLHPALVQQWASWSSDAKLAEIAEDKAQLKAFIGGHQLIDLASRYPAKVSAQELVDSLRKITPRLYSIASSQAEVDEEVHLTVAVVEEERDGQLRQGLASAALAKRLKQGDGVSVYVESNDNFRLPADDNTPVIMIGPGTGIAPFRAFMQEREAREAQGDNWLFFGNPTFTQDFLYQVEWQNYVKSGLLTRIDLAFSRDQAHKIYVQDRIREQGREVVEWLERGAHLYLCGDANRMAVDVEKALIEVLSEHSDRNQEQAKEYLSSLKTDKRYQKDVY